MKQLAIFERESSQRPARHTPNPRATVPRAESQNHFWRPSNGVSVLLTSQEAAEILKIHPKVLERMAKRGDVPALKVGKFWRYSSTALDAWINSRLQSERQLCRMKTSF